MIGKALTWITINYWAYFALSAASFILFIVTQNEDALFSSLCLFGCGVICPFIKDKF